MSYSKHQYNYEQLHRVGLDELFIRVRLDSGFEIRQSKEKGTLFAIKNIRFTNFHTKENKDLIEVTADMAGDIYEAKKYLKYNMEKIIELLENKGNCKLDDLSKSFTDEGEQN